jgi:hypothetical protein
VQAVLGGLDDLLGMIDDTRSNDGSIQIGIAEQLIVISVKAFGVETPGHLLGHFGPAAGDRVQARIGQLGNVAGMNLPHVPQSSDGDA